MHNFQNGWDELINILSNSNNCEYINMIFEFLLTKEEKEQLNKRILLTKELIKKEKSQRDIAKDINISICTVTRCSNALKSSPALIKETFSKEYSKHDQVKKC